MKSFSHSWVVAAVFGLLAGTAAETVGAGQNRADSAKSGSSENGPVDPLAKMVDEAIDISTRRYLTGNVHTPWQIMHGLLALRQEYRIKQDGERVKAIDWISQGALFRGEPWFQKTRYGGRAHPYSTDYAFEGHPNQFLAILAIAEVPKEHTIITAQGETITIADMVRHAQMEVSSREEITWTLWALSHYLEPNTRWQNKYGEQWSIEQLVQMQTQEPVENAACGGSHGLFSLTYARNTYLKTDRPLRGVWLEADQKIQRYIREARAYQNSDGTFSTDYFSGSGHSYQFETRLNTSGHTLEFLTLALPKERLKDQWIRRAVHAISKDLIDHRRSPAECGSLYHAMDGLVIYRQRTRPKSQPVPIVAEGHSTEGKTPEISEKDGARSSGADGRSDDN